MAGRDECSSRTTAHSGTERQIHVFVVVSTIFKMHLRTSVLPEFIYIKCGIGKYRYMPDRLRRFKAEFFQALAHPTRLRSSSSFAMGNCRPARSLNAWVWNRQMFLNTLLFSGQNES